MARTISAAYTPPDLKGKRLIFAEDDADTREFVVNVLERTGATVGIAADGLAALDEIQRAAVGDRPALIVLDFMLPGISGDDLIARLRGHQELQNIPLIILTAYPESPELRELPGVTVLAKPVKVVDIFSAIRRALNLPEGEGK